MSSECSCCSTKKVEKDINNKLFFPDELLLKIELIKNSFFDMNISTEEIKYELSNILKDTHTDSAIFLEDSIVSERIDIFDFLIELNHGLSGTNKYSILICNCKDKEKMIYMFEKLLLNGSYIDFKSVEYLAYKGYIDVLEEISSLFIKYNYVFRRWTSAAKHSLLDYTKKDIETKKNCKECFLFCIEQAINVWKICPSLFQEYGTNHSTNPYSIGYIKHLINTNEIKEACTTEEITEINIYVNNRLIM
jgi:hypothetical protein